LSSKIFFYTKMVEPTFLVGLAAVFLAILVFILKSSLSGASTKEQLKKDKKQKPVKERKPKGPKKNALRKEKRPNEVREWSGVDSAAKDAQEMLEFLKGKDPAELAKQQKSLEKQQINNRKKQQPKKSAKKEEVAQSSEDSSNETTLTEGGFSVISKKGNEKKKNQNKDDSEKKKDSYSKKPKPFFKPAPGEEGEQKTGEKKPRRERQERQERRPHSGDENVEGGEKKKRVEGEQENKERKPRRERPEGEVVGEGEDKPRRERQERPVRKPLPTVAPIVKYEQADLNDILNSITQDFKPKPKALRISTVFSKIPRNIVLTILSKLEARDLVALSEVNHYFSSVVRKDSLWKELLFRDFGIRDFGKYRNFRAAYRAEVKKRRTAKKKEVKEIVPQDEPKDSKAKKDNKKAEAPKEVEQATAETKEEQ